MKEKYLNLSQIGLYNPQRLKDDVVEKLFIVRKNELDFLMKKLLSEKNDSIPQHYLFIAQRGMGKTTLLKRIEVELKKPEYKNKFIPLIFPEEQYNLKSLSELWLNALDALADSLENESDELHVEEIDKEVKKLSANTNDEQTAKEAYAYFKKISQQIKRRPVMLIDNLSLVFSRLKLEDQHTLRAWMMQNGAPIIVGASAVSIEETSDYGAPFYDAFQIQYLRKLSFDELLVLLNNLAELTDSKDDFPNLQTEMAKLKTLHYLTGGNPRTATMLFKIIIKGFSEDINDDLEALLDEVTPLYKARFEELSTQMQIIVDAIALYWDPITIEQLREETHYDNGQLSPQLKRLVEMGWIEKVDAYKVKGNAYQISERFFNIWFLMRRSSRRQKRELYCLSKFLETFFGDKIDEIAGKNLSLEARNINHITYNLALSEVVKDKNLALRLRIKSLEELHKESQLNPDIIKSFDLPKINGDEFFHLAEIYERYKVNKNFYQAKEVLLELQCKSISNDVIYSFILTELGDLHQYYLVEYFEAENYYKKALDRNKKNAKCWNELGNLYQDYLQEYSESEVCYLNAIKQNPNNGDIWFDLATLYHDHLNRFKDAETAYLEAIKHNKDDYFSWNNLGQLYLVELNRYKDAEKSFHKALKCNKNYAESWNNLGLLYSEYLIDNIQAEKSFKNAIENSKETSEYYSNLGNLYQYNLHDFNLAKEYYLKAIAINDKDNTALYNLGNLYQFVLHSYYDAEYVYKKAITNDNKLFQAINNLGILYMDKLDKYNDAEECFKNSIRLINGNKYSWNNLGNLYCLYLNKYSDAEHAYKEAIKIDSNYENPWIGLGSLYSIYLHEYLDAEIIYIDAIRINKNFKAVWNSLGNLYQDHLHKYSEAENAYKQAIEIDNEFQEPKYNLVFLYRDKMKRLNEAETLFNTITVSDNLADSYWINKALFELYKRNEGTASEYLLKGLQLISKGFNADTQDDWYRFGAVVYKLNYLLWLLQNLEANGFDIILSPFYTALKALNEKDAHAYLNSRAVEIRQTAEKIMNMMKKYADGL